MSWDNFPEGVVSYGLDFHFGIINRPKEILVVNRIDGAVWGRFLVDSPKYSRNPNYGGRRILAQNDAHDLCWELNGRPGTMLED